MGDNKSIKEWIPIKRRQPSLPFTVVHGSKDEMNFELVASVVNLHSIISGGSIVLRRIRFMDSLVDN